MKKILFFILCAALGIGIFLKFEFNNVINNPLNGKTNIEVAVESGDSFYSVLDDLKKEGRIKNLYIIKYYIMKHDLACDIKPGNYNIPTDINIKQLINLLAKGAENDNVARVTIIEGMNIEEIAKVLHEKGVVEESDFLEGVRNYKFPSYVKVDEKRKFSLEGYLYPDTYEFNKNSKPEQVIEVMLNRFDEVIEAIKEKHNIEIDNLDEVITLASIIEKETSLSSERKLVSSVFHNRLEKGQKLQSCVTVIYSIGNNFYDRESLIVYNKDLKVDSPYNTYMYEGLPVGPIGSPRMESIEAALFPEDTDYLYFVLQNDGKHFFTKSYSEFERVKKESGL